MNDGGARSLFAGILRLVPFSGIQCCDISIPRSTIADTRAHFVEELFDQGGQPQRVLLPLEGRKSAGGADPPKPGAANERRYHPITGKIVDPESVLTLDGAATLDFFAGRWLPLPYLRFVGRDDRNRPKFDGGPSNWVRAYVAPASADADAHIVVAFDTALDSQSRLDSASYLAPNADDAAFGSTFICASAVDDLTTILAEPWLVAWLEGPDIQDSGGGVPGIRHLPVAHYLTFLTLLAAAGVLPEARFIDTIHRRFPVRTTAVDLIIDIGETETTALLVDTLDDQAAAGLQASSGFAEVLRLRDLAEPDVVHVGSFATAAEFSGAPFGDQALSRESGRLNAFLWPSLVRIGEEAKRLALRDNGIDGVTGLGNLRAFLLDDGASAGVWRQSTSDGNAAQPGPMVSSELMSFVSENGAVIGAGAVDPTQPLLEDLRPAIRPRFSRSSLVGFFASELALHALSQLNAATREGRDPMESEVRHLRQVVVLAPPSLSAQEQAVLLHRVETGLTLTWRGLGWELADVPGVPQRPQVTLGVGGDLSSQIAFLHNEVTTKYQGRFADLLRVYRGGDGAAIASETLRVASIDFGNRSTNVTIVDYVGSEDQLASTEWLPSVQAAERLPTGIEATAQALIWQLVLPSIEAHLAQSGLSPARHFLDEITGRATTSLLIDDPYFTRRLNRKVLWPAARGLLALNEYGADSIGHGNRALPLSTLVELGGGRLEGVAAPFDAAALQAGARGFRLAETKLELKRGEIERFIRAEMRDCVQKVARAIAAQTCDLLLVGGEGARLPALQAELLAALPLAPSRIVDLNAYINRTAAEAIGQSALARNAALLPAIATALDRRHLLEASGLSSGALRQLALPPASVAPTQRAIAGPGSSSATRPGGGWDAVDAASDRAQTARAATAQAKGG